MAVLFFLFGVVLAALGIADQCKLYWRFAAWRYRDPEANEPSDRAFAWQRGVLFVAAGVMVFQGCNVVNAADKSSWSRDELRQAVEDAASALEEEPRIDDTYDDYATLIDSEVSDAGKGSGPPYAVAVEASVEGSDDYTVTADGVDGAFCMKVSQAESDKARIIVPGAGGQSPSVIPEYDLTVTVDEGTC
ncbi:hypothetical protein [Streptomyces sp. NBC_00582]|uniref:hypothetical protein n=1 Tax=Streptomyces sp. NBC_00582 TaxID=2975783 RepID=UPI002E7FD6D6|nr:hypothetical protein [Streptomyces sp. NBC_00582]WUB61584.1 hypothetical protein OG852_14880 [Streptomyces sp. NBC_00582]